MSTPTPSHHRSGLRSWLRLIRLGNVLLSGAAAIVGSYLASGQVAPAAWLLIAMAPMLITAAGNVQNDLYDLAIDRLNRPERPLVTGAVPVGPAKIVTILLYVAGLIAAASLGWKPLVIAAVVVAILNLYNASWSRLPGLGNLAVSVMGALPVLYGGASIHPVASSSLKIPAAAALVAFWLHLARELLKDTVDIDGDRAIGRRTLPILHGHVAVMRIAALTMLIAAVCAFWLGTTGWFTSLYMFGICITILPALLYGLAQCWWRPELPVAAFWTTWLKVIMLAGLVWMVLSLRIP